MSRNRGLLIQYRAAHHQPRRWIRRRWVLTAWREGTYHVHHQENYWTAAGARRAPRPTRTAWSTRLEYTLTDLRTGKTRTL